MRYMLLIYADEQAWTELRAAAMLRGVAGPGSATSSRHGQFASPPRRSSRWRTATSVRVREGKRHVTDGPFAETREQLGEGFFLIDAKDLDDCLLRRCWADPGRA